MTATSQTIGAPSLERNAIGLPEVLFQSITHMAPAVATALSIGAATGFAGGITPLAVLFAMIACLFTAYSIGELARHLPSAGGMYTYVGRGLGPFFGWLMAWAFALAEPLVAPILFAGFGLFGGIFLATYLNVDFTYSWAVLAALCGILIWWLLYSGITVSTRTGIVLGVIEITIFVFISALLIANAGDRNTLSVFVPGEQGVLPALQGMVFCLLAFIGFEAAAPLGEETRDPKRTIRRAVIWSTILIGAFYVFNYYAATVFFGPDRMQAEFYTFNNGDPWGFMAEEVLPGLGGLLIIFAILNSAVANANSGATAATRSVFAMGRAGLLPLWFAVLHPERRTPVNAIHAQIITGIVIAVGLGLVLANDPFEASGPLNVYVFLGYMLGLLFAGMYIAVNVAAMGFYLRERRDEFNPIKHIVVPILGIIFMLPALLSVIGGLTIPILNIPLPALTGALSWAAPIVAVWMLVGIGAYFYLRGARPDALARVDDVYGEASVDEGMTVAGER
jgi:amino acid transporter